MTRADVILAALWTAVTLYAVLGGADFGGGVLDLCARGPRAQRQRIAVSRAMGPVWEANHVWLIFFVTGLFAAFPHAFETLSIALFAPATLALAGIVLRGAAFAFRSHLEGADLVRSTLGAVFGAASVVTPLLFGAAAGGLATGAIHYHGGRVSTEGAVWIGALPAASGLLAVAVCAYLAATFLCVETQRAHEPGLLEDFRRRALAAGMLAGALSVAALPLAQADAPRLYERLTGVAAPAVALGIAAGATSLAAIWRRRHRFARGACVAAVAAVIWGWGIAQYPQLAGPDVTVTSAAATGRVLGVLLVAGAAGLVLLLPSLWLLYGAFRRAPLTAEER